MQDQPQGFFGRLKSALDKFRKALGADHEDEVQPEPSDVQEYPEYQEQYVEPEDTVPPPPAEEEPNYSSDCVTGYYGGQVSGRRIRVKPRWYADNPDIECVQNILANVSERTYITIIICGVPSNDYPEKEGESVICLGYRIYGRHVVQMAYSAGDALGFANMVNSYVPERNLDSWLSLESISFLDVPGL